MKVLTRDGFKHFEAIIDQGEKDNCLRITFEDNSTLTCTHDHELLIKDEFVPACFIEIGEKISDKIVIRIEHYSEAKRVYDLYNVKDTHSYVTNGVESHNCNMIFLDEFAFVENAAEFYTSTYPVVSAGKTTKVIITSTANGVGNIFHRLYEGATTGKNEFKPFRVDWWDVPGRDEEWKKQTISNTSELQFEQEFGNCFNGRSNTLINSDTILGLQSENPFERRNGISYYEKPKPGHTYVMCVDVSKGRGQDYSTFSIFDVQKDQFKQVCTFRDNMISPLVFPDIIVKVAGAYNEAIVLIENNDVGQVVCNAVYYEYEYENTFVESSTKAGGIGVTMNKRIKRIGCSNLKDLVEQGKLHVIDDNTILEISTFESRGSSYQATDGNHDDLVMNLVLFAWFISSDAFGHILDMDLKAMLYADRIKEIEDDLLPFGFIDNNHTRVASSALDTVVQQQKSWMDV